jgi:hypothetical protein
MRILRQRPSQVKQFAGSRPYPHDGIAAHALWRYDPSSFISSSWDGHDLYRAMTQRVEINPPNEHGLYLRLFITSSGGL